MREPQLGPDRTSGQSMMETCDCSEVEGLEIGLFDRWLALFGESCAELLDSGTSGLLWRKAVRIAESLKLALFYRPDQPWPMGAA
jgi:hemoglobin